MLPRLPGLFIHSSADIPPIRTHALACFDIYALAFMRIDESAHDDDGAPCNFADHRLREDISNLSSNDAPTFLDAIDIFGFADSLCRRLFRELLTLISKSSMF